MLRTTWRSFTAHKARMAMSGLAVVLGVAFFVGTFVFTDTLKGTFDQIFASEPPDVVIGQELATGGDDGTGSVVSVVPQSVLDKVSDEPSVARATGQVQVSGVAVLDPDGKPIGGNGPPQLGASFPEFPDDPTLSNMTIVDGRAPAAPGEIVLDQRTVERGGFSVGDRVVVVTQGPRIDATLVGVARYGVSGGLGGATLALFDRSEAQDLFMGGEEAWTQLQANAVEGVSPEALRDQLRTDLGSKWSVETGQEVQDEQADEFATALGFINVFLIIFALIALFVGVFIILNTFSMLVARRTKELALLRAIGASRRQITLSVVGEAVALGLLGGITGLLVGIAVAYGLRALLGVIGLDLPPGQLVIEPRTIILGITVGLVFTLIGAWFPARRASRVPPVAAMRDDVAMPARSLRVRAAIGSLMTLSGAVFLVLSVTGTELPGRNQIFAMAAILLVVGVIVVAPAISRGLVGILGAPVAGLGSIGRMAVRNAQRDRRRTAATATAILIGLTLVTAIGVLGSSATKSTEAIVDDVISADYVVQPTGFVPFSPDVAARVAAVPGVQTVSQVRIAPALIAGQPTQVTAVDPQTIGSAITLPLSPSSLAGRTIMTDVETAAGAGLQAGDDVAVTWGNGEQATLRLTETYQPEASFTGWVTSLETQAAAGLPEVDTLLYVTVTGSADPAVVQAGFDAILADYPTIQIFDQTEFKEWISGQIGQLLNFIYALLGLSLVIAIIGVVNTLALSIIERTREIGMLRAVGTLRKQVRTMVRWESIVISVFGAVVGLVLGLVLGIGMQRLLADEGISILGIPWVLIAIVLVATGIIGVLAAVLPARRAANLDVMAAIRTE